MIRLLTAILRSYGIQLSFASGACYFLGLGRLHGAEVAGFVALLAIGIILGTAATHACQSAPALQSVLKNLFLPATQILAIVCAAAAFGNLAWMQVLAAFLCLSGAAIIKSDYLMAVDEPRLAAARPVVGGIWCVSATGIVSVFALIHGLDHGSDLGFLLAAGILLFTCLPGSAPFTTPRQAPGGAGPCPTQGTGATGSVPAADTACQSPQKLVAVSVLGMAPVLLCLLVYAVALFGFVVAVGCLVVPYPRETVINNLLLQIEGAFISLWYSPWLIALGTLGFAPAALLVIATIWQLAGRRLWLRLRGANPRNN
jgi:hypothetical protein